MPDNISLTHGLIRQGIPESKIDVAAVVGQFLAELSLQDLVVEMVQNDLDAGATRTVITFGENALICEGNGAGVDANGWMRLSYVLGAGGEVAAKKDGIGSKNHGLRALFLMADDVWIQSDGFRVDMTARGRSTTPTDFYPASWARAADPASPAKGTRITAAYRTTRLRKPDGDGAFLEPLTGEDLDALWLSSSNEAAERFITASAPGKPWRYELVLERAGQESKTFVYECKPSRYGFKTTYIRTCSLKIGKRPAEQILRRQCSRFLIAAADLGAAKVPRLFKVGGRTYGEVSWRLDRRGHPVATVGLLRYPIAFPEESALSGFGFDISAPFIAGRARHTLSEDARNSTLKDAARAAFASLAKRRLAKEHGPRLGVLVESQGRLNDESSDRLVGDLLKEGGLSVHTADLPRRFSRGTPMQTGMPLILACSLHGASVIDERLVALVPGMRNVLHMKTPDRIVARLLRIGKGSVERFDERTAAKAAFIDAPERAEDTHIRYAREVLEALARLRKSSGSLPKEICSDLEHKGRLPIVDGTFQSWGEIRRSKSGIPTVPGIRDPKIIHPAITDAEVLMTGPLRIKDFRLDELLQNRKFDPVEPSGRQSFFDWLKVNAGVVKKERLTEIAGYPIWPGADGKHRRLDEYCSPRDRRVGAILKGFCLEPAKDVIALARSKTSKGRLKIRSVQRIEEARAWYEACRDSIDASVAEEDVVSAAKKVARLEDSLDELSSRRIMVEEFALQHKTVAEDGQVRPVAGLHELTTLIGNCALPKRYLCRPRKSDLYSRLGARSRPSREALVAALREDPSIATLFIRLDQYKRAGYDLSDLCNEEIVPTAQGVRRAADLAFRSERDLWGAFKIKLEKLTTVPADHALLVALGVTTSSLKDGQSPEFFEWLERQPRKVQQEHLPQILRHWRDDGFGPASWAPASGIRCVPVYGKAQQLELLKVADAINPRSFVYLDDFPDLKTAAVASGRVRLAVDTDGKHASVIGAYASVGLRSLRQQADLPVRITIQKESGVPNQLALDLRQLQSPQVASALKTRLPRHGVALSDLKNDIRNLVNGLSGIRYGKNLTATYQVAGATFNVPTSSAVDASTKTVFVSSHADAALGFFNALSTFLFKPGSSPKNAWGLMMMVRERLPEDQLQFMLQDGDEDGDDVEPGDEKGSSGETGSSDALHSGHGARTERLGTPQAPQPRALNPIGKPTYLNSRRTAARVSRASSTENLRNSLEEQEHIRTLKEDHYAWHCQACLGSNEVLRAAPAGTYVYSPSYRKRLIEAHHVQHLQNAGGLGGGNLLILCNFHHDLLGDELSRDTVKVALVEAIVGHRKFPTDMLGKTTIRRDGLLATVAFSKEPFKVTLFFTKEHKKIWLDGTA